MSVRSEPWCRAISTIPFVGVISCSYYYAYLFPAPTADLYHWVTYYWNLNFNDRKITDHVLDHFDRDRYGLR